MSVSLHWLNTSVEISIPNFFILVHSLKHSRVKSEGGICISFLFLLFSIKIHDLDELKEVYTIVNIDEEKGINIITILY